MRKQLLPIIVIILLSIIVLPARPTQATNNITLAGTACLVPTGAGGWNISAAMHNNGLLYAAVTVGGISTGKIRIVVLDPSNPNSTVPGALGNCSTVAMYDDPTPANGFHKGSALQIPAIVKADSAGNIFIARATIAGIRLFIVDAAAPATPSGALGKDYVRSVHITGASAITNSGGGMDVSDDYLVASISQDMAATQRNRYTIVSKATLFALPTVATECDGSSPNLVWPTACAPLEVLPGTWHYIMDATKYHAYTKLSSGSDGIAALPDGRFFISAAFEKPTMGTLGGFLNPVTNTITNPYTGASGWENMCVHPISGKFGRGACFYPSAYVGLDNNLYIGLRSNYGEQVLRYNTTLSRWESATGAVDAQNGPVPSSFDTFFDSEGKQNKFGTGIASDGQGQVFVGSISWPGGSTFGPLNIAYYNLSSWLDRTFSGSGNEWGKPALVITPYTGEPGRLSVLYVRDIQASPSAIWITYNGNIVATGSSASVCTLNLVVNGGLTYVNSTTASAAVYANTSCQATQYYAVASNSATPPSSVNMAGVQPFDPASGAIEVTGLTAGATNYIHVRLLNVDNSEIGEWLTQAVYVDTDATVGATISISSPFTKPRYTDVSTMDGSSYTDSTFVRSNVGLLSVDAVSDPSGLSSYTVNSGQPVNYSEALLGQGSLVLMRENTGSMGADLVLRDGAGNTENRSIYTLTLDAEPPVATGASVAFSATGTSPFNGEVTLTPGTSSDNEGIWGLWLASAYCGANNSTCPANTSSDLRWGAAPLTSNVAEWNLLTGNNIPMSDGVYRVYARLLDGAGNPSATFMTADVTVTMSNTTVFAPIMYAER